MINKEDLNLFFSRNSIDRIINKAEYDQYYKTVEGNIFKEEITNLNVLKNKDVINILYKKLSKSYRNEYFYKNTLFSKRLLGTHSINSTTALAEIPIARSIADFILINGKATLFEIKSDVDRVDRLTTQIKDYYKAFSIVYIVTKKENCEKISNLLDNKDVGILYLNSRNKFSYYRKAEQNMSYLDYETMFKILRKKEYENIIIFKNGALPKTNSINHFSECFKIARNIPIQEFYDLYIKQLKNRMPSNRELFLSIVPEELRYAVYFLNLSKDKYNKLDEFLNKAFGG